MSKQRGLAYLTKSQGDRLAYVDTCYNGEAMCGTARLPGLVKTLGLRPVPGGGQTIRFGGGAAVSKKCVRGTVQVGDVVGEMTVDVVPGHLPLLLGTCANDRFGLDVKGCGMVVQKGVTLAEWSVAQREMPWVEVRSVEACRSMSLLVQAEAQSGQAHQDQQEPRAQSATRKESPRATQKGERQNEKRGKREVARLNMIDRETPIDATRGSARLGEEPCQTRAKSDRKPKRPMRGPYHWVCECVECDPELCDYHDASQTCRAFDPTEETGGAVRVCGKEIRAGPYPGANEFGEWVNG